MRVDKASTRYVWSKQIYPSIYDYLSSRDVNEFSKHSIKRFQDLASRTWHIIYEMQNIQVWYKLDRWNLSFDLINSSDSWTV